MTILLAIFWIALISAFTLLGAYYAKRFNRTDALIGLYVTMIIFSNIVASKVIEFDFGFTKLFAPGAVLIFSVTFLMTDIVNERFGRRETLRMILIALFAQIALVLFSNIVLRATPAPFFQNQQAFEALLGTIPRIVIASLIAFYVSETADAYIFHWFRKLTQGKHLWMRNAFSSLPAMTLDSILFVVIAFASVLPIIPLIIGLSITKWLVGIVDIPFMYLSRAIMGKHTAEPHEEAPLPYAGI